MQLETLKPSVDFNGRSRWGTVHILSGFQVIIVIVTVRGFAGFLNREICFDASGLKFPFQFQELR